MCEDTRGAAVGVDLFADTATPWVAQDRLTSLGKFLVPAHMVGVAAGVDDVTNPSTRQPLDCRQDLVRHLRRTGVDQNDACWADLHCDIAARAGNHVEVWPNLHNIQIVTAHLQRSGK